MTGAVSTLARGAVAAVLVSAAAAQSFARCSISASGFSNSKSAEVGVAVGVLPEIHTDLHLHLLAASPPWSIQSCVVSASWDLACLEAAENIAALS